MGAAEVNQGLKTRKYSSPDLSAAKNKNSERTKIQRLSFKPWRITPGPNPGFEAGPEACAYTLRRPGLGTASALIT